MRRRPSRLAAMTLLAVLSGVASEAIAAPVDLPAALAVSGTIAEESESAGALPAVLQPPEAVVAIGANRRVSLSWLPSPSAGILGYNVYRSTREGEYETVPLNRSLVPGTEFIDDEEFSTAPPENGVVYYYTVKAVDLEGRLSVASEQARARPEGAPVITEVPKIGWEGFGESKLSVSGRKVVSMGFTIRVPKNSRGSSQLSGPQTQRLTLEQQLQVRLNGTVGKKISVDVDYDDTAPDQTRQRISVVYAGDPQETIERAEFGDIRLKLADTEFTGYDKQLFGVRLQAKPTDKLRLTGIATQTQGINASETFVGGSAKQEEEVFDTSYISHQYFYITRPDEVSRRLGIRPGSEQIWMDDNNPVNDVPGVTQAVGSYQFDFLRQGADYSIDYDTGVIYFSRPVPRNAAIAVAFEYGDGTTMYFDATDPTRGVEALAPSQLNTNWDITSTLWAMTTTDAHMIYDGLNVGQGDAHMITNIYRIGFRNIVPKEFDPDFTIRVFDKSGNEVTGIISPVLDSEFYDFGILKIRHDPASPERRKLNPDCPRIDPLSGLPTTTDFICSEPGQFYPPVREQPFAYDIGHRFIDKNLNAYMYGAETTKDSHYRMKLRFLTQVPSYRLRNINIVRGSERITRDGRLLTRDVDYFVDYDFGQVTFLRPDQVRPDSQIQIDYEYLPFGGQFQSFLWGARGEYSLNDRTVIGTTYLSNRDQNPQDAPSPTAAPRGTTIIGADGRTFLSRRDLSQFIKVLPGFEHAVMPLEMEVRGELAKSDINPNTFSQPGSDEKGGALIDSMEGVDDVISTGVDASAWFPASIPQGAPLSPNDRAEELAWSTGEGGHPGLRSDLARTLDLEYRSLGAGKWDAIRYILSPVALDLSNHQFLEMWIHGDGSGNQLVIDLGTISEDGNGNGLLDSEDVNEDFTLNAGEDLGLPDRLGTMVDDQQKRAYWGAGNRAFWNGEPGPGGNVLNTEDMNRNNALDNTERYFEYRIPITWSGWNFVQIPLGFDSKTIRERSFDRTLTVQTTKGSLNVGRVSGNNADPDDDSAVIRHLRLWVWNVTGGGSTAGALRIETIAVTGNRWLTATNPDSGFFPDSSRFRVSAISEEVDGTYVPLLTYFIVRESGAEEREKSLKIEYNLHDDFSGNYYATRVFRQPIDMLDYQELRFDVNKVNVLNQGKGEFLFVRAGGDDRNYYQFNIPLDHVGPGWQTMSVDLRDERNRHAVGSPALSGVKQFSFGVMRLDPPDLNTTETIWVNNLRLVTPRHKTGVARKVNVRFATPMGATFVVDPNEAILPSKAGFIVDTEYRDIDNDFRTIDQPMERRNDQHNRRFGAIAQIRQFPKLPISANFSKRRLFVEERHRDDPKFFFAPDEEVTDTRVTVTSQHLNPLSLDVTTERHVRQLRYLTPQAGADVNYIRWSTAPRARLPLDGSVLHVIPVGKGGEVSGTFRYTSDETDWVRDVLSDRPSTFHRNLVDRKNERIDEQYTFRTSYRPLAWTGGAVPVVEGLTSAPRISYRNQRERGPIGALQVANIADLIALRDEGKFRTITQNVSLGVDNRLTSLKGLTPSSNYRSDVAWNFVQRSLTTKGSLTNTLDIRPGDWLDFLRDQSFSLSYIIDTNAQYYDLTQVVNGETVTVDRVTTDVPAKDIWWVNRKDDTISLSNAFVETYSTVARFVFWRLVSITPNWSLREQTQLQQRLRTRQVSTTAGTGLSLMRGDLIRSAFRYTPLFFLRFSGFDSTYNFRKNTSFDFKELPVRHGESHSANTTLPFSPMRNMTGNFSVAADKSRDRTPPALLTLRQSVRPSVGLGYSRSAGLEFPFLWWRIKLSNLFHVRSTVQMNFIDNEAVGRNFGTRKAEELQGIFEFEYEMLRGVNLRIRGQYDQVKDVTTPNQSFRAFTFLGTFLFNF